MESWTSSPRCLRNHASPCFSLSYERAGLETGGCFLYSPPGGMLGWKGLVFNDQRKELSKFFWDPRNPEWVDEQNQANTLTTIAGVSLIHLFLLCMSLPAPPATVGVSRSILSHNSAWVQRVASADGASGGGL